MISLNINESKKLRFKISLSGIQPQDLKGSMRIMVEGIEYGFPINIDKGDILVNISPIAKIHEKNIKDGSLLDAKLEVIAGDHYLLPWQDKIRVDNPMKVEATVDNIVEEISNLIPKVDISVSDVSEEEIEEKKKKIEDKEIRTIKEKKKSRFSIMLEK